MPAFHPPLKGWAFPAGVRNEGREHHVKTWRGISKRTGEKPLEFLPETLEGALKRSTGKLPEDVDEDKERKHLSLGELGKGEIPRFGETVPTPFPVERKGSPEIVTEEFQVPVYRTLADFKQCGKAFHAGESTLLDFPGKAVQSEEKRTPCRRNVLPEDQTPPLSFFYYTSSSTYALLPKPISSA